MKKQQGAFIGTFFKTKKAENLSAANKEIHFSREASSGIAKLSYAQRNLSELKDMLYSYYSNI